MYIVADGDGDASLVPCCRGGGGVSRTSSCRVSYLCRHVHPVARMLQHHYLPADEPVQAGAVCRDQHGISTSAMRSIAPRRLLPQPPLRGWRQTGHVPSSSLPAMLGKSRSVCCVMGWLMSAECRHGPQLSTWRTATKEVSVALKEHLRFLDGPLAERLTKHAHTLSGRAVRASRDISGTAARRA